MHDNFMQKEECTSACQGTPPQLWVDRKYTAQSRGSIHSDIGNYKERVVSDRGTIVVRTDPQPYPVGVRLERVIQAVVSLSENLVHELEPDLLEAWCKQEDNIAPKNVDDVCAISHASFTELQTPVVASDGRIYELNNLIDYHVYGGENTLKQSPFDRKPLSGQVSVLTAIQTVLRHVPKYYALQKEPTLALWCRTCSTGSCSGGNTRPPQQARGGKTPEPDRDHPVFTMPRRSHKHFLEGPMINHNPKRSTATRILRPEL